jgi:L-threonylcarbamoyladenylate synthase
MDPSGSTIVRADPASIRRAAVLVRAGEVVGFPTETLYGLAALALSRVALERLVTLKARDPSQPISVMVEDRAMLGLLVDRIPESAAGLMDRFWPGPLTLVLPARRELPGALVGARGGVGVRISSDPVAAALVRDIGAPMTATSANLSGTSPATTAAEASISGVALVLDDGPRCHPPSTVVEVIDAPVVLRQGAIRIDGL